ncbi:Holliday junction resolvase RuvX [Motiliproteus sp. MSK22-1]|uniref:Holliday junction resolvase RuvX n=1 Tax=Motiliproteus sp. MSK22-1 TaxID=1897630 RepID=UPI0009780B7B|nr:Holliday junction resolvase RuvX [Motiliproteus sp. MSK22-1]OMH39567.1 Holliday junction DNA helicase RuvA [Motiliproteus sp. MSK22-1]
MILSFDFGTSRIGIAVGQAVTCTATPLKPVLAKEGTPDWNLIAALIDEWQPKSLVVGLPLNMDGSLCEMSYRARKFGNRLQARFHLPVYLVDERLTSHEAKGIHLSKGGKADFKENSVDGLAAQLILESWFRESVHRPCQDKLEGFTEIS